MNQDFLPGLRIVNYKSYKVLSAAISKKRQTNFLLKTIFLFLSFLCLMLLSSNVKAQETLMGLTSNGGVQGKGTVFTIKTNATSFAVVKALPDWGKNPNGNLVKGSDGNFYGMTLNGGTYNFGTIFKITSTGTLTILRHLNSLTDGANPYGSLTIGTDGNFYGLTSTGGTSSYGTIFKITSAGVFTVLRHFSITADGANPQGNLVLGTDGNFYGITRRGGSTGYGTIFKVTPGGTYTVLRSLANATDGGTCYGSLAGSTDGNFYGITSTGGTFTNGTIFKVTPTGTYTVLRNMKATTDGSSNTNSLVSSGSFLYGLCYYGGTNGQGTIFKISTTGTFTVLRNLNYLTDGSNPRGSLIVGTDGNLYGMNGAGGANAGGTILKISTTGTFSVLRHLTIATDGGRPAGALFKNSDGNYYGMTSDGGSNSFGTIFKISATGTYTVLTRLNGGIIGNSPYESLMQATDFGYYGTTLNGGTNDQGTVFKICGGVYSVLHSFKTTTEGGLPKGSLLQASDGNLYGVTSTGGTSNSGTIFKITTGGTFTVLRHLVSVGDGSIPQGSLIQGADNFLYGLTSAGGANGGGTIFKISTAGASFKVIRHLVPATDGTNPEGNLVKGAGGVDSFFYGMTKSRIFKISPGGKIFTILRTLNPTTDGNLPLGSLLRATDGNFYGTNSAGGSFNNSGTIFKITPTGTYTVLRHLNSTTDGGTPKGNLIQAADGFLYGLTSAGGTNKAGTIFKISTTGAFTILRQLNLLTDGGTAFGSPIVQKNTLTLVANPQSVTTSEDVAKSITVTGSGGSPITFKISTAPKNGTVTGSGPTFIYTPKANYNGKDSFYFTSNVACVASPPAKVRITITAVNDAPVLAAIGNKSVAKGALLTFTTTATDVDAGQTKTFSLITPPSGATISASTGVFNWTPSAAGSFTFRVRVTDNGSPVLFDEEQITVTVTTTFTVTVANYQFTPSSLNVTVGDVVKFVWSNGSHTTTSLSVPAGAATWDAPMNSTNTTFSYKVTTAGSYSYQCTPHAPGMKGSFTATAASSVTISSFYVNTQNNKPLINWTTKTETNSDYFSIRKSTNGSDFKEIGKVRAAGNSSIAKNYSFPDEKISDTSKYVYYFFAVVDKDGKTQLSPIEIYRNKTAVSKLIVSLYPNPINEMGHLMLKYNADKQGTMLAKLIDMQGRVILKTELSAVRGVNDGHIHLGDIPPGVYTFIFNLNGKNESYRITKK